MSAVDNFNKALVEKIPLPIDSLIHYSHECAKEKGWHDPGKERTVGEYLMLMVSELSEALEEHRNGHNVDEVYYSYPDGSTSPNPTSGHSGEVWEGKPEGVPIELADVLIRIFDFCGLHNIDLESALMEKMQHNFTRSHRHGGKVI